MLVTTLLIHERVRLSTCGHVLGFVTTACCTRYHIPDVTWPPGTTPVVILCGYTSARKYRTGGHYYACTARILYPGRPARMRAGQISPGGARQDTALVHAGYTVSGILRAGIPDTLLGAMITARVTCWIYCPGGTKQDTALVHA